MAAEAFRSRIGSALANRDFAEAETAFREYASLHPEDHEYLVGAAGQLLRHDKGPLAGELLVSLAQTLLEKGDVDGAFETARAALRASQRPEGMRDLLIAAYTAKHGKNPNLATFLAKSGLSGEGAIRPQIEALDRYLTFAEGAYVYHRGGWGYGVVAEFDPAEEKMVVDFQRKPGHQIGIQNATKILERLSDDHIGVYKHYRKGELKQLMETDPARVFRIFLRSHAGKGTLKQVREEFVPDLLDKNEWSRWWTRAKKAILKDPEIKVGKGSIPPLELRHRAHTVEQEVADRMRARTDAKGKVAAAREVMRSLDMTPSLAAAIEAEADAALPLAKAPADRIALLYLKADLKTAGSAAASEEAKRALPETADVVALFTALDPADRKRAAQDLIASGAPDATERVVSVLKAGDVEAADSILDHLKTHRPDVLITFFGELSTNPRANPELFLWYARGFLHGSIPVELAPGEKETTVIEKLLTLGDQIGLEVGVKVTHVLGEAFGDRLPAQVTLGRMVEAGRLGKRSGVGFYDYAGGRPRSPAQEARRAAGDPPRRTPPEDHILDRLLLPMVNEAARILDEGLVRRPQDVDLGLVLGTGFPPFRGGLLRWADRRGVKGIATRLDGMAAAVSRRFEPSEPLRRLERFYPPSD